MTCDVKQKLLSYADAGAAAHCIFHSAAQCKINANDGFGTRTAAAGTKTAQAEQGKVSDSISSSRGLDRGRKRGGFSISHQSFSTHNL